MRYKLVILDCGNTLTQGDYTEILVAKAAKGCSSRWARYKWLLKKYYQEISTGFFKDKELSLEAYKLLKDFEVVQAKRIAMEIPLTHGARETVSLLKDKGYKLAIFSDGFSILTEYIKDMLGIEDAFSNDLDIKDGRLTGGVIVPYYNPTPHKECLGHLTCKRWLLRKVCMDQGLSPCQVVSVGDGLSDICLLRDVGLGIAFCPSKFPQNRSLPQLEDIANEVIRERDLRKILEIISKYENMDTY